MQGVISNNFFDKTKTKLVKFRFKNESFRLRTSKYAQSPSGGNKCNYDIVVYRFMH